MYNLLLVDDEKSILDGLYYNIDWNELEIRDVFRAADVPSALEILGSHHIDIVITDIRMPGTDGLTLCDRILKLNSYTKIIILSGYKDFDYAQRAINIKVFRYVLKPLEYEALKLIVGEALTEIKQDLQQSFIVEEAKKKIDQIRPFIQERYLNLWLEKGIEAPWKISGALAETGLDIYPGDYGFFVTIKVDEWISQPVNSSIVNIALKDLSFQLLCENCRTITYHSMTDSYNLLFLSQDRGWLNLLFKQIVDRLEFFQLSITESLGCTVSIFWDFPVELAKIGEAYQGISERIRRRIGLLSGGILGPEADDKKQSSELKTLLKRPSLLTLLSTFQKEKLTGRIAEIFKELRQPEYQTQDNILQTYHAVTGTLISDSLQRNVRINQWGKNYKEFFEDSNTLISLEVFAELCYGAINQYMDYIANMQLTQNRKVVEKIKYMIEEQISSDISVSSLSRAFNYNSNYLSRIFKLETGTALQDYIIQVRIEKAKALLAQGERVSDISAKVGYENFPHFSRIFKKIVGVSPKQYQVNFTG